MVTNHRPVKKWVVCGTGKELSVAQERTLTIRERRR
jgi:hypothetical protein